MAKRIKKTIENNEINLINTKKTIASALYKKAVGYDLDEVIEEYQIEDNTERLIKRKVTKKKVPPDTSAVKTLLEFFYEQNEKTVESLTDEELEQEKIKLLKLLKNLKKEEKDEL